MKRLSFIVCLLWAALAHPALSHEFWIDSENYQVETGESVTATLRNGQDFKGITLAYFDQRVARFDRIEKDQASPVIARAGDSPAFDAAVSTPGLFTLVYRSQPEKLTYKEWVKFQNFIDHKQFGDVRSRHAARGFDEVPIKETYTRLAKALFAVGDGAGADAPRGLELEIVALKNPYTDPLDAGLPVQVLYREIPRIGAQVEIFERAPDGSVIVTTQSTDDTGITVIAVKPGHTYLLDNVVLREPAPQTVARLGSSFDAQWETLWAALTFMVPH